MEAKVVSVKSMLASVGVNVRYDVAWTMYMVTLNRHSSDRI